MGKGKNEHCLFLTINTLDEMTLKTKNPDFILSFIKHFINYSYKQKVELKTNPVHNYSTERYLQCIRIFWSLHTETGDMFIFFFFLAQGEHSSPWVKKKYEF